MNYPLNIPYQIILGSQSPRRKDLLGGLGIPFEIEVISTDEAFNPSDSPASIAQQIAENKGKAFLSKIGDNPALMIITADTIVSVNDQILNKPIDRAEALEMLQQLSNNTHQVFTGVSITTKNGCDTFYDVTKVYFEDMSIPELEYYVDQYKPYDKAGAYGVQEWIGYVGIKKIEGCFFNVMGLPLHLLYQKLKKYHS